tara:strand:- start:39947 stop:40231 length:285 start_codon:yes stop_codon:yes gene_type:complete
MGPSNSRTGRLTRLNTAQKTPKPISQYCFSALFSSFSAATEGQQLFEATISLEQVFPYAAVASFAGPLGQIDQGSRNKPGHPSSAPGGNRDERA